MITRPMLAASWEPGMTINFPVLATPKIDGIRCITHPLLGPVSRNFKPIPNIVLRAMLSKLPAWLDGELVIPGNFQSTSSAVMSAISALTQKIEYWVFDRISQMPYRERVVDVAAFFAEGINNHWAKPLLPVICNNLDELFEYEAKQIALNFEGVCFRHPMSPYKSGRSTAREQWLVKMKRYQDEEAKVIGFEEEQENQNVATQNSFGLTERSSHQAGLVGKGSLGSLRVENGRGIFHVGSGFTFAQRQEIWKNRERYLGRMITFKFFPVGMKDLPRHPVFKCFREDI